MEIIVRGICCLIPGLPGKSENIRVRSFLGRFLEHSRMFRYENAGGEPIILMGSADWMPRNFERRVECIFPITNKILRRRLEQEIIQTYATNLGDAKSLQSDGSYVACAAEGRLAPTAQDFFLRLARNHQAEVVTAPKKDRSKSVPRRR